MKYKFILIFLISGAFFVPKISFSQNKIKIPWQVVAKDSIVDLMYRFSRSLDLNYTNEVDHMMGTAERENQTGINMFKSLFKVKGDSTALKREILFNFIDTAFIRLYTEFTECSSLACKEAILLKLNSLPNRRLTVNGYIDELKKYFNIDGFDTEFFPGTFGSIQDSSLHIENYRYKIAAKTYAVDVFAKLGFGGTTVEDKAPAEISFHDLNLFLKVVFEEVKTTEGIVYRNFRIGEISNTMGTIDTTIQKHILNVTPFINGGIQSVNGNISNVELEEAYRKGTSQSMELGLMLERRMILFKNEFTKATVATGVTLFNFAINSSLISGYEENSDQPKEEAPFVPSSFLKNYSIASTFSDVEMKDKQWFVGIPIRLGLEFGVDKNNKLRGYFQTSLTWYLPVSSSTKATGKLNQTGVFIYEHVPGFETLVTMKGDDNPFPDYFGVSNAFAHQAVEWKNGMRNKTEAGIFIKLKNKNQLMAGPYFSYGSFTIENPSRKSLAKRGGEVFSPINAMDKLNILGYGVSIAYTYDITKTILDR